MLRQQENDAFDLLRRMVAINSFTNNPAGVDALGKMTAEAFAELGFTAEQVPIAKDGFGPHLVLERPGKDENAPQVGLVSHLDTVYPEEEEERHDFRWREDGDRIYGPGTVDIKGGTVVIFMVLDALRRVVPEVFESVHWVILMNAAEEQLELSFGDLCRERLDPQRTRACLIFEGALLEPGNKHRVVVARKGMGVFRVTTEGRASHAGNGHHHGANAILQMADVVREIESWTDPKRAITFNVGVIEGGSVINQVPPSAMIELEMRTFAEDVFNDGKSKVLGLRDLSTVSAVSDGFACKVHVDVLSETDPWPRNEKSDQLLAVWQEAAAALGMEAVPEERGGLSDGNQFWNHVPTLDGMGPSGGNAHSPEHSDDGSKEQEYATRSSFVPRALLNTVAILRLLGHS